VFFNPDDISPMAAILPAMFAKSSLVLNSIFYIYSNQRVKDKVFNISNKKSKELSTSRGKILTEIIFFSKLK
jgi:hypothetical protein